MARRRNPSGFNLGKLKVTNTATNNKFFVGAKSNEQPLELNNNIYLAPGAPRNQGISRLFPNADVAEAYASLYSRYQRGLNTFPEFVALESIEGQDFEVSYFPSRESVDGYWRTRKYVGDTIVREVETTVRGSINYSQWQPPQLPIIPEFNYEINSEVPGFNQEITFRGTDFQLEGSNGPLVIGGQTYDGYNWSFDSTTGSTNLTLVNNVELQGTQVDPLQLMGYNNESNYTPINATPITVDTSAINWGNVTPELVTTIANNGSGFGLNPGVIDSTYDLSLNGPQELSTYPPSTISEPLDPIFFNTPGDVGGGVVAGTYQCDGQAVLDFGGTSLDFDAATVETVEHDSEIICSGTGCVVNKVYLPDKKSLIGEGGASGGGSGDGSGEEVEPLPSVFLGVSPQSIAPDGESKFTYTFQRTGNTDRPLKVLYTIGGSASNNDYSGGSPGSGSITIPSGSETATLELEPRVDNEVELYETIDVSLRESSRYRIGTSGKVTATIQDYGDPSDPCYEFRRNGGELLKESQDIKEPYGLFIFPASVTETEEEPAITLGQVVGWNLRYSLETVEVGVEPPPEDPPPPEEVVPPEDAPSCTWYEASEAEYNALAIGSTISWSGIGNGEIVRGKSQLADDIYMILGCVE